MARWLSIFVCLITASTAQQAGTMQRDGVWNALAQVASSDGTFTAFRLNDTTIVRKNWRTGSVPDTLRSPKLRSAPSLAYVGSRLYIATEGKGIKYFDSAGVLHDVNISGSTISFVESGIWYGFSDLHSRGISGFPNCGYLVLATSYTMGGESTNKCTTGDVCFIDTADHVVKYIYRVGDLKAIFSSANGNQIALLTSISGIIHVPIDPDDSYWYDMLYEFDTKSGKITHSAQLNDDPYTRWLVGRVPVVPIGRPGLVYIDTELFSIDAESLLTIPKRPHRVICGLSAKRTVLGVDAIDGGVHLRTYDVAGGATLIVDTLLGTSPKMLSGWASQSSGVCYVMDHTNKRTYRYRFSDLYRGDTASIYYENTRTKLYSQVKVSAVGITPFEPGKYIYYFNGKPDTLTTPTMTKRLTDTGLVTIGVKIVSNKTSQSFSAIGEPIPVYRPDSVTHDFLVDAGPIYHITSHGETVGTTHRAYTTLGAVDSVPCTNCFRSLFSLNRPSIISIVDSTEFWWTNRTVNYSQNRIDHFVHRSPIQMGSSIPVGDFSTEQDAQSVEGRGLIPYQMAELGTFWREPSNGRVRAAVRVWLDWSSANVNSIIVELIDTLPQPKWQVLFTTRPYSKGRNYPEMYDVDYRYPNEVLVTMSEKMVGFTSSFDRLLFEITVDPKRREYGAFRRDRSTIVTTQSVYSLIDGIWVKTHSWPFHDGYKIIRLNDSYSFILKAHPDTVGYIVNHDEKTIVQTLGEGFGEPTCASYDPKTSRIYIGDKQGSVAAFTLHVPYDPITSIEEGAAAQASDVVVEVRSGNILVSSSQDILGVEIFDLLGNRIQSHWLNVKQATVTLPSPHAVSPGPAALVVHTPTGTHHHIIFLAL